MLFHGIFESALISRSHFGYVSRVGRFRASEHFAIFFRQCRGQSVLVIPNPHDGIHHARTIAAMQAL
jgi:hypothetical protein